MTQSWQWLAPWQPSLIIVVSTLVPVILFLRGCARSKMAFWQKAGFWAGIVCLYGVLHTQLEYYAEHAFFAHQLQSLALHHLGPFLIVLSGGKAALWAGCPSAAKRLLRKAAAWRPLGYALAALKHPGITTPLFVALIGFWLLPSVHFIAMLDSRIYGLMNASMVLIGLAFWESVLIRHARHTAGWRIAMMLAAVPPQVVMGALIFLTPQELYPVYSLCGRAFSGMGAITDQQVGGLILWMHAAMMSAIGVLIVIRGEIQQARALAGWGRPK